MKSYLRLYDVQLIKKFNIQRIILSCAYSNKQKTLEWEDNFKTQVSKKFALKCRLFISLFSGSHCMSGLHANA